MGEAREDKEEKRKKRLASFSRTLFTFVSRELKQPPFYKAWISQAEGACCAIRQPRGRGVAASPFLFLALLVLAKCISHTQAGSQVNGGHTRGERSAVYVVVTTIPHEDKMSSSNM
jgi:hypothetical protein